MTVPTSTATPTDSATTPRRWRRAGCLLTVLIITLAVGWVVYRRATRHDDRFPLTPIASSPFLNTKPDARYVGTDACIKCHADEHASFLHTGMGRSMARIDLANEPPDGAFDHPVSKRRYQIVRKDGQMWHRELLISSAPSEVLLSEFPVKYVVGSGRHARTYLVETDGFLVESPATWYASKQAWAVSPGYDHAKQLGFARAIGEGCLFCHASQSETLPHSTHRTRVTELAIGCERCHGPGSLHVECRTSGRTGPLTPNPSPPEGRGEKKPIEASADGIDYTIVNPAHLSRELAEAICQQCHLNSDAAVSPRGRDRSQYRPGLRLQDFHQVYVFDSPDASMTVVGHVEQMHASRCYQASERFTCLTCHDPHGDEAAPARRREHYKAVCLQCHKLDSCKDRAEHRQRVSPTNDCLRCHMPQSPTDITHLAFTHHRVGIHPDQPATAPHAGGGMSGPIDENAVLRPFLPDPGFNEIDRQLELGQAYRVLGLRDGDPERRQRWQKRALGLLGKVRSAGLRDGDLEAALAQLTFDLKVGDAMLYADSALSHPDLDGQSRCDALFVRAQGLAARGDTEQAIACLRELTEMRRYVFDWLFLANYQRDLGQPERQREALLQAIRINPRETKVHHYLADYYGREGDTARARWHELRAVP